MKPEQREIYYLLADDAATAARSPHLDYFRKQTLEVLFLTDPLDSFMLQGLQNYEGFPLKNAASGDLETKVNAEAETVKLGEMEPLIARFKQQLGERVTEVRVSERLVDSPLRLVAPPDSRDAEMDRVRRMLEKDYIVPKRIVELNPRHALVTALAARLRAGAADELVTDAIEQLYANALLLEGLHPNPAEMVGRIQALMERAVNRDA
jgi:molecular chaperone HtpG